MYHHIFSFLSCLLTQREPKRRHGTCIKWHYVHGRLRWKQWHVLSLYGHGSPSCGCRCDSRVIITAYFPMTQRYKLTSLPLGRCFIICVAVASLCHIFTFEPGTAASLSHCLFIIYLIGTTADLVRSNASGVSLKWQFCLFMKRSTHTMARKHFPQ